MSYSKGCVHAIIGSLVRMIYLLFLSTKILNVVSLACRERDPKVHPKTHLKGPSGLILFWKLSFACIPYKQISLT